MINTATDDPLRYFVANSIDNGALHSLRPFPTLQAALDFIGTDNPSAFVVKEVFGPERVDISDGALARTLGEHFKPRR